MRIVKRKCPRPNSVSTTRKIGTTAKPSNTPKAEKSSAYEDEISVSKEAREYLNLLETKRDAP